LFQNNIILQFFNLRKVSLIEAKLVISYDLWTVQ